MNMINQYLLLFYIKIKIMSRLHIIFIITINTKLYDINKLTYIYVLTYIK